MRVEECGHGEPEYAVIGAMHGDEPCGEKAIDRVLGEDIEFLKPVKFVIANEEALAQGARFLDTDLNRSFPGDPGSENHEERLAAEVLEEVRGMKVMEIHSTKSTAEPFATFSRLQPLILSLVRSSGVSRAVHFHEKAGTLNEQEEIEGFIVEAGLQGTEEAAENAYRVLKNFLAAEGVIDAEYDRSDPEIFRYSETVELPEHDFVARNFELVEEGDVYARRGGKEVKAEEDFYPVLMSTHGYDDILGFKAERAGRASEVL